MLLKILHYTGQPLTTKNYLAALSILLRFKWPGLTKISIISSHGKRKLYLIAEKNKEMISQTQHSTAIE